ncbi:uncharacterized protein LOC126278960 [Schistocerca gregaria]|uniref:uncharacterized protein LOC126278960 n=1 Tax=Schistocerca gregaria TaxID=7010 RepID=UPI00211EF799|nr:uncharacterized protein LOC126278960 [Schistocerca gregaria]
MAEFCERLEENRKSRNQVSKEQELFDEIVEQYINLSEHCNTKKDRIGNVQESTVHRERVAKEDNISADEVLGRIEEILSDSDGAVSVIEKGVSRVEGSSSDSDAAKEVYEAGGYFENSDNIEGSIAESVRIREGEFLEKCFDLSPADRLTKAASIEEEEDLINMCVISAEGMGFDRREVVRDVLEELDSETVEELSGQTEIEVVGFDEKVPFFLDSGSDVCAGSKYFADAIPNRKGIIVMPVYRINIVVATGKSRKAVTHEVMFPAGIQGEQLYWNILIIFGLSVEMWVGEIFAKTQWEGQVWV